MSHKPSTPLKVGFKVLKEIPVTLNSLANDVVKCYQRHHFDLRSVFVIGSVAVGEWTEKISDLDVVGVVNHELLPKDESARRRELLLLGDGQRQVSFINNSTLNLRSLASDTPDMMIVGRARIIAVCGLHLWGEQLDLQDYVPTVEAMAYERTARAKILMDRYRSGIINEPFRSDPRLLARSCAKAAIRVLSSITILRGAVFYISSQKTVTMVEKYAPEALHIAQQALDIVNGSTSEINEAICIADRAIELFHNLYSDF